MVIYAEITLGSIISLLCAVAVHNWRGDLGRDTELAGQTADTALGFNDACSPPRVSDSTDAGKPHLCVC